MTRHLFLAVALAGTALLLNAPAQAVSPLQCENRAANCIGSCTNYTAGAGDYGGRQNKCMAACDRRVISCLVRANPYPGGGILGWGL